MNVIAQSYRANLFNHIIALRKTIWPDFLRLADDTIFKIYARYADYQLCLFDGHNELMAIANAIPLFWSNSFYMLPQEGVSWVIEGGLRKKFKHPAANTLCAISISIAKKYQNKGISKMLLTQLKQMAMNKQLTSLIVPVRPSLKSLYPLISMEKYIQWKNEHGVLFDPWLRTHLGLGAEVLNICYRSACVTASIYQWEQWTNLAFPGTGSYVIKQALVPLRINYANNLGTYIEPNVWVRYPLA